jgi:hypothetical protein
MDNQKNAASRRAVFRGISLSAIAAGLAVPALASIKPDDGADAELIQLCAEARGAEKHSSAIDMKDLDMKEAPSDEKSNAAVDNCYRAFKRVAEIRATTMAGIQAKAMVLRLATIRQTAWQRGNGCVDDPEAVERLLLPDGLIALSLVEDVLAGRAVA